MKILVTGGSGMVGSNIKDLIPNYNNQDFTFLSSKECDLRNRYETQCYFEQGGFDYIIHLASKVGGLYLNMAKNIQMFSDNIKINENVLEACYKYNIRRGIFILSSCIYTPNPSKFPMNETMIHEGPPHPSNEGYAYAKRMMEVQCRQYNSKYDTQYICLVPVNLYGPYDNFKFGEAHVIPELMHRFHDGKKMNDEEIIFFGTGKPLRQFLFAEDFAKIILRVLFDVNYIDPQPLICSTDEVSIKQMVETLCIAMDIDKEKLKNDESMTDGCMKKTVSNEKLKKLYSDIEFISLEVGLKKTYNWFINNYENIRK
jgi:GDP-L-fucose synthase